MHFMPDTEDEDSAAETFWPEGYKQVIREDFRQLIGDHLNDGKPLRHVYQQRYSEKYNDLSQFTSKIVDMIAIGAENGADNTFDEIVSAFLTEFPLPTVSKYAHYFWPKVFTEKVKNKLRQIIIDEYGQDNVYQNAYKVGYEGKYRDFDDYIQRIAEIVVTGAINGADDMLEAIYQSYAPFYPLPPARRLPRRLKQW